METVVRFLALCGDGLQTAAANPAGLPVAMLLAGLAGSLIHCTGMCGPFVLGQVIADTDRPTRAGYGEWHRLAGAALAPYHLGRLTTYVLLGAIAGEATGLFASTAAFGWLSGALLIAAALLLITQALGLSLGINGFGLPAWLSRLAGPLAGATGNAARYGLGVLLGFLPCGLLYGALAAAAGTGSGSSGGLAMVAFALGTMPALVAVGWGGLLMRRKLRGAGRWMSAPLLFGNALVMLTLASQRF